MTTKNPYDGINASYRDDIEQVLLLYDSFLSGFNWEHSDINFRTFVCGYFVMMNEKIDRIEKRLNNIITKQADIT